VKPKNENIIYQDTYEIENAWRDSSDPLRLKPAINTDSSEPILEQSQKAYLSALETAWQSQ